MNNNKANIVLGTILIIMSVVILTAKSKLENNSESKLGMVQVKYGSKNKILRNVAIIEFSDKSCTPCLVNIEEYIILIKENYSINDIKLKIYSDSDKIYNAKRLLKLRNWDNLDTIIISDSLIEKNSLSIFSNKSITRSQISNNVISDLSEKEIILNEHFLYH